MDDIRVSMGGTEMELRPISARQYLSARMEAEKMAETLGGDQVAKAVLLGASLLAKGLFDGDKRLFNSADEVIDTFDAEEIVNTAGYIDLEQETKMQIVEDMGKIENIEREIDTMETKVKADVSDSSGRSERALIQKQEDFFAAKSNTPARVSRVPSLPMSVNQASVERSLSPRSDMQRVSDFFQRDSRRYDGNISSY